MTRKWTATEETEGVKLNSQNAVRGCNKTECLKSFNEFIGAK